MARKKVVFPQRTIAKFEAGGWKVEMVRRGFREGNIPFFNVTTMRGDGTRLRNTVFGKAEPAGEEFTREKKRIAILIAMEAMGLPEDKAQATAARHVTLGAGFFV